MAGVYRDPAAFPSIDSLADVCGVGTAKLTMLFRRHAHTTSAVFLNRARVGAASRLLLETRSRVADIGYETGFESSSAFSGHFLRQTGLAPKDYRRMLHSREFPLHLPENFFASEVLRYHGRDPLSPSERVSGSLLAKVLRIESMAVEVRIELGASRAHCAVDTLLSPAGMAAAHLSVLRILGLAHKSRPGLARRLGGPGGLRIPLTANVFEALVWAILGQQINLRFAAALRRAVIHLAGEKTASDMYAHPCPAAVARLDERDLAQLQISKSKAEYLLHAAREIAAGRLPLEYFPFGTATQAAKQLHAQRGIGPWTTQYVLLRGCGFPDCVPAGDSGLAAALERFYQLDRRPVPKDVEALMEPFAPDRSLATYHFWRSL